GGRLGVRLVVGHVEGGAGRIDAGHLEPAPGQAHRERPGPTADVDHRAGTELLQDRLVVVQVVAFAVESVVTGGEERVGIQGAGRSGRGRGGGVTGGGGEVRGGGDSGGHAREAKWVRAAGATR